MWLDKWDGLGKEKWHPNKFIFLVLYSTLRLKKCTRHGSGLHGKRLSILFPFQAQRFLQVWGKEMKKVSVSSITLFISEVTRNMSFEILFTIKFFRWAYFITLGFKMINKYTTFYFFPMSYLFFTKLSIVLRFINTNIFVLT